MGGLELTLSHDTKSLNISVSGPADVWFGFGFGATAMKDQPYALIVDGEGAVTERKLADHAPGKGDGIQAIIPLIFDFDRISKSVFRKVPSFCGKRRLTLCRE